MAQVVVEPANDTRTRYLRLHLILSAIDKLLLRQIPCRN